MRLIIGLLAVAVPALALSQTVVNKTTYGVVPASYDSKFTVSPDGQHVAVVKSSGSRRLVSIDGADGEIFDSIELISGTAKAHALSMNVTSEVIFSPDGKRYAYGARRGSESFVVVDGKTYPGGRGFIFSADSSRFAYYTIDQDQRKFTVVLDGVASPPYDYVENLKFSDDGRRLIYVVGLHGSQSVVVDGKPTAVPGKVLGLVMAPHGPRYAYLTSIDQMLVPVVDGVAQKIAARAESMGGDFNLQFSADGRRWAITSVTADKSGYAHRAVVDGKPGPAYFKVEELGFSPDGKRYGYIASVGTSLKDARKFLVIDGKKSSLEYRELRELKFSPDGKRFSAEAMSDAGTFAIVDGKESEAFHTFTEFTFSNSGRYTFLARPKSAGRAQIYIDGQPHTDIKEPTKNTMTFSPDGSRLVFGGVIKYPESSTYFDGKMVQVPIMNNMGWVQPVVFSPDGKHVAFMSDKDAPKFNVYLDLNPGVLGLMYAMPTFSADGRHFAIAGRENKQGNKWTVFVDGKAVTEVDDVLTQDPATWQFGGDDKLYVIAKNDKQFVRYTIDTQGSSLDAFTANMSKSGKTAGSAKNAKNAKAPMLPGQAAASSDSPAAAAADEQVAELEKKQSELQRKIDEMNKKAKEASEKKMKKLKGLTDIFK